MDVLLVSLIGGGVVVAVVIVVTVVFVVRGGLDEPTPPAIPARSPVPKPASPKKHPAPSPSTRMPKSSTPASQPSAPRTTPGSDAVQRLQQRWSALSLVARSAVIAFAVVLVGAAITLPFVGSSGGYSSSGGFAADQGDEFVQGLKRNQRISIDEDAAVDMATAACNAPLQGVGLYNAQQAMQQRHPEYDLNIVAVVMAQGVLVYCPERLG